MTEPTKQEVIFYKDLIGSLIRAREEQGISQERLNEMIGVSDGLVNKWESGARLPSSFYLMCWCLALGMTIKLQDVQHGKEAASLYA